MERDGTLLEGLEPRLHTRNRAFVHARYQPGRCPYCSLADNLQAMIRDRVRVSSPKAVEPS